jgi:hypothetical protein
MEKLFKFFGKGNQNGSKGKEKLNDHKAENMENILDGNLKFDKSENNINHEQQEKKEENNSGFNLLAENNNLSKNNKSQLDQNKNISELPLNERDDLLINSQTSASTLTTQINFQSSLSTISNHTHTPDVVVVNQYDNTIKKSEGFYYKKYIDKVQKLQLSNPILVERENMKVNFDYEVMDYLVNDMTLIFKDKQDKIDKTQVCVVHNFILNFFTNFIINTLNIFF